MVNGELCASRTRKSQAPEWASHKKLDRPYTHLTPRTMATIYTARNIVGNDKTTPLFSLKGLPNHAPTTVSNLNFQGIALERQVAYTQYAANISAFVFASLTRKTITISPRPYGYLALVHTLPLDPPSVSFTLSKALDSDRADKLVNNLGPGASRTQSGKTIIFHAPALPIASLDLVNTVSTAFFNAGRDAINPKGMKSYLFLNTVIMTFLHVHSYPAFRDEDPESITIFDQLVAGDYGGSYTAKDFTKKDAEGKDVAQSRDLDDYSYTVNENRKRVREEDEMDSEPTKLTKTSVGYLRARGHETVFRAKPVTKPQTNIGSIADIPKSHGLIFPYFHGLLQPDAAFMNNMVLRRFYQLLGSTHESCQSKYLEIRHGINSLATTSRGMEICHILLGIDLALDTQSRCFVIVDKNKYLGFALLGARYAVFANTRWFAPANEEIFSTAISRMDPHESAVADIITKLEKLKSSDQYTGMANRSIFAEPETLVGELAKLKLTDIDDEDIRDLDRFLRNLNYMGTGYLSQNPQMIADMLATLASTKDIALSRPTYLPSIKAPFSSRSFKLLSQFGPEAPSFWNDRGTEIICKPVDRSVISTGGKRKIGDADIFGNMPEKLLITPKPLLIAVRDMDKVIETGKVKMDVKERAGRYRNISLEHEDTRKSVWKGLIDLCAKEVKKVRVEVEGELEGGGVSVDEALLKLLG